MNENQFSEEDNSDPKFKKMLSFQKWRWVLGFSLGIIFAGIFISIWPERLYQILSYLFGGSLMFSGIYKIFFERPYSTASNLGRPGLLNSSKKRYPLFWGVFYIVTALILFLNPVIFHVTLPFIFGFMVFFTSLFLLSLTRSFSGTRLGSGLLISGVIFLLVAFSVFIYPETWGTILGRVMGFILIGLGFGGIILSSYLKRLRLNITSLYDYIYRFRR